MENNKIKKEINNIVNDNLKALEQLFPSAVKDGQLDIKALKEELGDFEEVGIERYELNWAGKQNAKKVVQQGIGNKTLKFVEKDSKNADSTENIYIEGDNLEVLKLLRQNYYNSIKMIYIDPPYNTGNDFVYNDTFKMDKEESDKAEGIISENNEKLQKNQKSTNRYHANWLNMMYPRLKLARDLLTDDGVIFISIDDNEQANLKRLCDEIFGEENFVVNIVWQSKSGGGHDEKLVVKENEYILLISKNKNFVNLGKRIEENNDKYKLSDEFEKERGKYLLNKLDRRMTSNHYSASLNYEIIMPDGSKLWPGGKNEKSNEGWNWRWSKTKLEWGIKNNYIEFKNNNNTWSVYSKQYEFVDNNGNKIERKLPYRNILLSSEFSTTQASNEIISFFNYKIFEYSKSTKLLNRLIKIGNVYDNDVILDFFSGSATTAHAVMQLNSEDDGNRKYIMVQLPETTDEKSEAFKAGYKNIAEIGKERIRRAGEKIKQEIEEYNSNLKLGEEPKKVPDIGFKVFKVDDTNIKWYDLENFNEESQYSFDDPDSLDFVLGSNDIDIVYEIMLRQNDIPLSERLEVLTDIGNRTYFYASTYLICLETEITEEMVEKLASLNPLPIKFVFRDSAFKDNISLKDETFRKLRSLIERNSGESKVSYRVEFI
ncbi:site-specific DNA-methyltransferase [Leptotrichia hongkongensis]|uniref:Site-specific DNA-methyltransferase n=1 Tax=Leptotrichia hongkongensis TaxID=554406 RepID=A0ABV4S4K6_9FUSO